jgi:hypothetical protein
VPAGRVARRRARRRRECEAWTADRHGSEPMRRVGHSHQRGIDDRAAHARRVGDR